MSESIVSQALPAFNSLFKRYYFSRTQRGGAGNAGKGERSRLHALARWLQRRMVFLIGTTDKEIKDAYNNESEEKLARFDGWVRENGGTIEYGMSINPNTPICLEELDGPIEDDWEVGCLPTTPLNDEEEAVRDFNTLLDTMQDNDDL